jgi:hypothetical protein
MHPPAAARRERTPRSTPRSAAGERPDRQGVTAPPSPSRPDPRPLDTSRLSHHPGHRPLRADRRHGLHSSGSRAPNPPADPRTPHPLPGAPTAGGPRASTCSAYSASREQGGCRERGGLLAGFEHTLAGERLRSEPPRSSPPARRPLHTLGQVPPEARTQPGAAGAPGQAPSRKVENNGEQVILGHMCCGGSGTTGAPTKKAHVSPDRYALWEVGVSKPSDAQPMILRNPPRG